MDHINEINSYIEDLKKTLDHLNRQEIDKFAGLIMNAYEKENQIFIFGNGGSASTASHFACDLNKGVSYGKERRFKIIALTDNLATIMAYSNDVGYDDIFIEQLKNFLKPGDLVIGISGSGNSKNVLKAVEYANRNGAVTVGLTGYDGGSLKKISKYSVNANISDMQISEDIHIILSHMMMKIANKITAV